MKKNKKYIILVIVVIPILIIFIAKMNSTQQSFNSEKWSNEQDKRYLMIDDMLKRYAGLKNMSKNQVLELLGEPSKNLPSGLAISLDKRENVINTSSSDVMVYLLNSNKMPENTKALYIKFDKEGIVIDYSIIGFTT